ncbi:hypothetical protein BDY21DRAFT_353592 [Lineolata rhizophorae]|uniref:Uncharacterized protein n=1 Tax=Lineolata rhizophorae TaxID=578093 RepID=A0A6A6NSA5_9PEZI|nr:hypothetical protein BDY21DRAFT_353592 [Lineolata rhizophorae]
MSTSPTQKLSLLPSALPSSDSEKTHSRPAADRDAGSGELAACSPRLAPAYNAGDYDDDVPYPEGDSHQLLPPPNFAPFFSLIDDIASGEHYHPAVHYVFADDDPDLVTAASLQALGVDSSSRPPGAGEDEHAIAEGVAESQASLLPPPRPGVRERFLIVDLAADGQTVTEAKSLNADWQVTETVIGAAPTWDEDTVENGGAGLMLRIEGTSVADGETTTSSKMLTGARSAADGDLIAGMDGIVRRFEQGMQVLRKVTSYEADCDEPDNQGSVEGVPETIERDFEDNRANS